MGLNDIELSPANLVSLFGTVLVEPVADENPGEALPSKKALANSAKNENLRKHLGNNGKHILIAVCYQDAPILPDSALSLLTNMLSACKLSLDDVAIVNFQAGANGKALIADYKSKQVLLFGIEPAAFGLPVNFPAFQVQAVAGNSVLYSPSLEEIAADKLIKSKLWVSLQRFFKV